MDLGYGLVVTETVDNKGPKQIKMLMWSVFAGSRGCSNRVKIVFHLRGGPCNTNQLSEKLGLDYKVVQRHLNILKKHHLLSTVGAHYGVTYFNSPLMESNFDFLEEIVAKSKNCK